jgi:bifunctional enzyme CysN/CysC
MYQPSALTVDTVDDIQSYLKSQEEKSLLRFITCGSVDDGKSTLIGRLLWDSKLIFEDQLATLEADSRRLGTQGEKIDYALLLDGLQAEREQGITIDVAYRFFATDKRKFIVADTPGHEQYTRNMVTAASTAQVAVILVDARKGVLTQTRRHSYLASLVGIRHVLLAVNKMDLIDYDAGRFAGIVRDYCDFAAGLGFAEVGAIPISALEGDNILARSPRTPWHQGPTLMESLETVAVAESAAERPFRMAVQWVNRPHLDFRGFCGTIASGTIRTGDPVVVASSGKSSRIASIVTMDGELDRATAGQAVTLTLQDEIDISRGDLLASGQSAPKRSERFSAKLVWLHEEPLRIGHGYLLKAGTATVPARVETLHHKIDVNTLDEEPGAALTLNEVGLGSLIADRPIDFDPYRENHATGSFILIDRLSHATVAAGMIEVSLPPTEGCRGSGSESSGRPRVLWFSGPSTTRNASLSRLVEKRLHALGYPTFVLDSARLQQAGVAAAGPQAQLDALSGIARLLVDAGLLVLVAAPGKEPPSELLLSEAFTAVPLDAPDDGSGNDDEPLADEIAADYLRNAGVAADAHEGRLP